MTRNCMRIYRLLLALLLVAHFSSAAFGAEATAPSEWEKIVKAAEQEGEVVYSASGSHRFLEEFHKSYPKIKTTSISASCNDIVSRIMTERRAGKYLADVVRCGLTSAHSLLRGKTLQPVNAALSLAEVRDPSKWWQGKHHYADAEGRYLFVAGASAYLRFASYNSELVNPAEFKSYWDLLNPKWKGKIVATDPRTGEGRNGSRFLFYNPDLGPNYLRRLLGEMDMT